MELRFGFITGNEKTQKEVADMLRNITKLYFKIRKEDYKKDEKRNNEQNELTFNVKKCKMELCKLANLIY